MFLLTSLVMLLLYGIYMLLTALGNWTQSSSQKSASKDCLYNRIIPYEAQWLQCPLCPIQKKGDTLYFVPEHGFTTHSGWTYHKDAHVKLCYGYDKVKNEYGIVDKICNDIIFHNEEIIMWCNFANTHTRWIHSYDCYTFKNSGFTTRTSQYTCAHCGYTTHRKEHFCPECRREAMNY